MADAAVDTVAPKASDEVPKDVSKGSSAASLNSEEADKIRSQALATEKSRLPSDYFKSPRVIGSFAGTAIIVVATYFQFQATAAVLSTAILQDIGPSVNTALVPTVWTISQPISLLLFGRLSDRFGRRGFALGSCVLAIIGAIVAATAQSIETLIGAQVLMGIASGVPASYPLLAGELMSNKEKYIGTAIVVVPNVIATGFGAYIGLRLAVVASWRWIYYIFIMMQVPGSLLWFFFYHPPSYVQLHGKKSSKIDELKKIDFIGVFLLTAGLALFLLGISWGGPAQPWSSPKILGLLISGAVASVSFILYEVFLTPAQPIIPMRFFRDLRGFTCLEIISATYGIMNIALFIMWPQQVSYIFGSTVSSWEESAWLSTTAAFGLWGGIVLLGPLMHYIKHIRYQIIVSSIWMTAFLGAMASITVDKKGQAIAFSFLGGLTIGWGEVIAAIIVQYVVSDQDLGVAFSVISASRTIFGSIFTAAFIAVYVNKVPGYLASTVPDAVVSAGLPSSSLSDLMTAVAAGTQSALQAVPGMNEAILRATNIAVSTAYSRSYAYVYYFAVALGGVAIIASVCLRDFDQYLTEHVSRQLYHKAEANTDPLEKVDIQVLRDNSVSEPEHEKAVA
ncbi:fungal trichothecene efflux pump [Aaosphaeria arxii CBS 175.79]|uniref:Fungal trichothecene efflux pump n=1 Tax=Aaosphaeria arxii CBS 175.79 TaxID=1450172 RepID=A0A6A5XER6_9PLEO|nr:fungal trichothecene efflux pump [Aaosphaeria arxii CBS 175.79]KAF2011410.1 fungal trichothecene efflux pump [Aaosphaeria arxii CBS 175.79]